MSAAVKRARHAESERGMQKIWPRRCMQNSGARHAKLTSAPCRTGRQTRERAMQTAPCKKKPATQKKWPLRASNTGPHASGTKLPSTIHLNTWLHLNVDSPATTFIKGKDGKLTLH